MATIKVLNASQVNPEAPVEIKLGIVNEPDKPIQYVGIPGPEGKPGKDGKQGPPGPKGDTPIKGVDYFTSQDIADIAAQVPVPEVDLTDYASKSFVETAIRGAETGLLKRSIVEELPSSNIDDNTIYMVPNGGSENNAYDEYLFIDNAWEHIGSTEVDLTGYATEQYVNNNQLSAGPGIKIEDKKIKSIIPYYIQYGIHNLLSFNGSSLMSRWPGFPTEKYILPQAATLDEMANMLKEYGIVQCNNIISPSNSNYGPSLEEINTILNADYSRIYCYDRVGKIINRQYAETNMHKDSIILLTETNEIMDFINGESVFLQWIHDEIYKKISGPNPSNFTVLPSNNDISLQAVFESIDTNLSQRSVIEYLSNSDVLAIWNGENN